jgi:predicted metal-dependent hydrolase
MEMLLPPSPAIACPVLLKVNRRARRIQLKLDITARCIVLTLPHARHRKQGEALLARESGWVERAVASLPPVITFTEGAIIPVMDQNLRLSRCEGRGIARRFLDEVGEEVLHIPCEAEFFSRRVEDWIKKQARQEFNRLCHEYAELLAVKVTRITLADPQSRWGSCTKQGRIMLSWRLALAPRTVMEYVIAHEVAHLKEMNHSPAFWRWVAEICPHHRTSRAWLKQHGASLHAYGVAA